MKRISDTGEIFFWEKGGSLLSGKKEYLLQ